MSYPYDYTALTPTYCATYDIPPSATGIDLSRIVRTTERY